jgi:hypothetical protein
MKLTKSVLRRIINEETDELARKAEVEANVTPLEHLLNLGFREVRNIVTNPASELMVFLHKSLFNKNDKDQFAFIHKNRYYYLDFFAKDEDGFTRKKLPESEQQAQLKQIYSLFDKLEIKENPRLPIKSMIGESKTTKITENMLRKIIKEELIKEMSFAQPLDNLRNLGFIQIPDLNSLAKGKTGHGYNNGAYSFAYQDKYYYLSPQNYQRLKAGEYHEQTPNRIMSLFKELGVDKDIGLPVRAE